MKILESCKATTTIKTYTNYNFIERKVRNQGAQLEIKVKVIYSDIYLPNLINT